MSGHRSALLHTVATIVAVSGLLVTLLIAGPAAAERSPVPAKPNIVDPAGDANGIGNFDISGPAQVDQADILAAWLTSDRKTITAHWHMAAAPTVGSGIQLRLVGLIDSTDPVPQDVGRVVSRIRCLFFSAVYRIQDAGPYKPYTAFTDLCIYPDGSMWFNGTPKVIELEDGTAIVSHTVNRRDSPNLKSGTRIDGIRAASNYAHWVAGQSLRPGSHRWDGTETGRDYTIPR